MRLAAATFLCIFRRVFQPSHIFHLSPTTIADRKFSLHIFIIGNRMRIALCNVHFDVCTVFETRRNHTNRRSRRKQAHRLGSPPRRFARRDSTTDTIWIRGYINKTVANSDIEELPCIIAKCRHGHLDTSTRACCRAPNTNMAPLVSLLLIESPFCST